MKTTIAELYESGERFAAITVHFPSAGHIEVEGRIRHVPNSHGPGENYWVDRLCLPATAVLEKDGEQRSTWSVYLRNQGA